MSFFFRKNNSQSPQQPMYQNESDRLRGRQVSSLIRAGGKAINHEQTLFDFPVHLTDNRIVFLRITLPTTFPVQAPIVETTSAIHHHWVRNQAVVGHDSLNNWNAHSDLGRIVTEIASEFRRNPPQMNAGSGSQIPYQNSSMYSNPPYQGSHPQPQPPNPYYPQQQPNNFQPMNQPQENSQSSASASRKESQTRNFGRTQMPVIPVVYPELEELSTSQLERMNSDKQAMKAFVRKMESVQNFVRLHDDLVGENADLAKKNLEFQPTLNSLQSEIELLKVELMNSQEELTEKQKIQQGIVANFQPKAMVQRVQQAAADADEQSEDLASQFTGGEISSAEFISQYVEQRTKYHMRNTKVIRFAE